MSQAESPFRPTPDGYFMAICGPAWKDESRGCQKKLCFVATDQAMLADVLRQLAERPDCVYVKYSVYQKDGMYLGRCFLMDEHEVGASGPSTRDILVCSAQSRMTNSRTFFVRRGPRRAGVVDLLHKGPSVVNPSQEQTRKRASLDAQGGLSPSRGILAHRVRRESVRRAG